jgi:cytochrome oxidase Cu insertion factor (SCO1/SenC/PrrC family)
VSDGERDNAAAVKEYLARLSPDVHRPHRRSGCRTQGRGRVSRRVLQGSTGADASAYQVEHSGPTYLIDAAGRLRAELYDPPVETNATAVRAVP